MSEKYPLQDLLRVRKFREDAAAQELTKAREKVKQAKVLVAQRETELTDYVKWRIAEEKRRYDEILKQSVQVKDLDSLKQEVQLLREKEFVYQDRIREAKDELKQAEKALEEATARYRQADKDVQKIEEHHEMWAQDMAKKDEMREEKELEDFRVRAHETADTDSGSDDV